MVEQATTTTSTNAPPAVMRGTLVDRTAFGRCPRCGTLADLHACHDGLCSFCFFHPLGDD
ncbi:MAG: hypothetical protein ACRDOE_00120 [Streptosporangiaceae bacterium]